MGKYSFRVRRISLSVPLGLITITRFVVVVVMVVFPLLVTMVVVLAGSVARVKASENLVLFGAAV